MFSQISTMVGTLTELRSSSSTTISFIQPLSHMLGIMSMCMTKNLGGIWPGIQPGIGGSYSNRHIQCTLKIGITTEVIFQAQVQTAPKQEDQRKSCVTVSTGENATMVLVVNSTTDVDFATNLDMGPTIAGKQLKTKEKRNLSKRQGLVNPVGK